MFTLKDFKTAEIQTSGGIYGGADCATGAGKKTMSNGDVISWSADTKHDDESTTWHSVTDKSEAEEQC
jgi:hypothetical protein